VSDVVNAYRELRRGGTSHPDAIDVLLGVYDLDRATLRGMLQRAGALREHFDAQPPAPSRAAYLESRPRDAKGRRAADRRRNGRPKGSRSGRA
jgi:hypothetical protein